MNNVFGHEDIIDFEKYGDKLFYCGKSRPIMLICETVNICNNNCIICAYSEMTRKKEIMPLSLFEKVVKDYSNMGGGVLSLTPMVGEVLCDKYLAERIEFICKFENIHSISFTTNAIGADKFSDEKLRFILKRLKRIHISIYGLSREEYRIMTRKDHYDLMLRNVRRIIQLSDDTSKIGFGFRFLKRYNERDIKDWIYHNFTTEIPFGYTNSYANWSGALDTSIPLPFDAEWIREKQNMTPCLIPLVACQVFANGDVSFCSCDDYNGNEEFKLGNINNNTLLEMYNQEKVKKLWNFMPGDMPSYCRRCTFHKPLSTIANECENVFENPLRLVGG